MQLSLRDAARLLQVAERTIVQWVEQGRLKAERVQDQYRFHRSDLLEWATSQQLAVALDLMADPTGEATATPALAEAIEAGGVFANVPATDRATALRAVVERLPLPPAADREFVLAVLLSRESLGSTAVGDGIAIPHVRNPMVVPVARPLISLCFLAQPIPFGAHDGSAVHTLFTLLSGTVRAHLQLLSRLALALRDPTFRAAIVRKAGPGEVFAAARAFESRIASSPASATSA
jgi:PTS system nitrogen regulatory IIA component